MLQITQHLSYKEFLKERIASMPNSGRGQLRKIALHLNVHPTLLSQVISGRKDFSLEQGISLCEYLGLGELEREYFLLLLQYDRAGSKTLKVFFHAKIRKLQEEGTKVSARFERTSEIREEDKAVFYSHWQNSAVRLLTSINEFQSLDGLSEKLKLPKVQVRRILDFLLSVGLVKEDKGRYIMGTARTHVPSNSPYVIRHHVNWRLKAFEAYEKMEKHELALTFPMTISKKDSMRLRELLVDFVASVNKTIESTDPEDLMCLNIDYFSPLPR